MKADKYKLIKCAVIILISIIFNNKIYANQISFDQLATSADLTSAKYNADLNVVFQDHNTSINSGNILDDSLSEADMADDINPRIRTFEGASCQKVDDGLLNTTTVGTLSGPIPIGTAYPRGFRCDKISTTARTWTASRWTFLDIDQNCDFQFSEVAIGAATPAIATNSIRISRVSTDGTQIANVQDLRTTSCASGTFDSLVDSTGEANLDDILSSGRIRVSADIGFAQGLRLSWDGLTTTFSVLSGDAVVSGKFRRTTGVTSVPQTADDPANGTSGLDTGAIAASTRYYVYGVADQDAVKTMSFSISTNSTTPSGITNYRKLGQIKTDASSNFVSQDMLTFHTFNSFEIISGGVKFDGTTTPLQIGAQFNISSITDNGTGDYTINWDTDFNSPNHLAICSATRTTTQIDTCTASVQTSGTDRILTYVPSTDAPGDAANIHVISLGDKKE